MSIIYKWDKNNIDYYNDVYTYKRSGVVGGKRIYAWKTAPTLINGYWVFDGDYVNSATPSPSLSSYFYNCQYVYLATDSTQDFSKIKTYYYMNSISYLVSGRDWSYVNVSIPEYSTMNTIESQVGSFIESVYSDSSSAYPQNGVQGNYYYNNYVAINLIAPTLSVQSSVIDKNQSVVLSWTAIDGISSYIVEKKVGSGNYTQIYSGSLTTYTDNDTNLDSQYIYYRVKAQVSTYSSDYSNEVQVSIKGIYSYPNFTNTQEQIIYGVPIQITWSKIEYADTYILQRKTTGDFIQIYSGSDNYYQDTISDNVLRVEYKVCAGYNGSYGDYSPEKTYSVITAPSSPSLVVPSVVNFNSIFTISWDSIPNVDSYVISKKIGNEDWIDKNVGLITSFSDIADSNSISYRAKSVITDQYESSWSSTYSLNTEGKLIEINIKKEDGTYEPIYPATYIQNINGISSYYYDKDQTLSDSTLSLWGDGITTPDQIFAQLGSYNQYWWRRRLIANHKEIYMGDRIDVGARGLEGTYYALLSTDGDLVTKYDVYYSDTVTINKNSIELENPQSVKISYNDVGDIGIFRGKYVRGTTGPSNVSSTSVYYVPDEYNAGYLSKNRQGYNAYVYPDDVYAPTLITVQDPGEWEYVWSTDSSAYPNSGISGQYEYFALGQPFNNIQSCSKIVMGSYIGTGATGQNNPTTIDFGFSPKIVIIYDTNMLPCMMGSKRNPFILNFENLSTSYMEIASYSAGQYYIYSYARKNSNTKLQIYATATQTFPASDQLNTKGQTYTYILLY